MDQLEANQLEANQLEEDSVQDKHIEDQHSTVDKYMDKNIEDLTLRLLLNNKNYKQIMCKKEDSVFNKQTKLLDNRSEIHTIVENIINNDTEEYTNDILDTFNAFVKSVYKHWDMLEIQNKNNWDKHKPEQNHYSNNNNNKDDDTIFENMQGSLWSGEKVNKIV